MTVLLVEDEHDLAEMYMLQLVGAGYRALWAPTAESAIDQLDRNQVDVIVLDMLLPRHNGLSILHELRSYEDWQNIPVIIFSNVAPIELGLSAKQLENLGVASYLVKSHTKLHELAAAIESVTAK